MATLNPLTAELERHDEALNAARRRRSRAAREIGWFRNFDRSAIESTARAQAQTAEDLEAQLLEADQEVARARRRSRELEQAARAGLNPAHWVSPARHRAKAELRKVADQIAEAKEDRVRVAERLERARRSAHAAAAELDRFEHFDVDGALASHGAADVEVSRLQADRAHLAHRKEELDHHLGEPVAHLEVLLSDQRHAVRRRKALLNSIDDLQRDIKLAQELQQRLSAAPDKYQKRLVHEESERKLGDGSPGSAAHTRRQELKQAKRELSTAEAAVSSAARNIAKVEGRIAEIVRRRSRDIRSIVIDGSNLCFKQDNEFIGLDALRPLAQELTRRYVVTVFFDASTRTRLKEMSNRDLRDAFPGTEVHVVPGRTGADETILAVAQEPSVYVLSNDRFQDFQAQPAVKEDRLIKHSIVNGRVIVADLDVNVSYTENAGRG